MHAEIDLQKKIKAAFPAVHSLRRVFTFYIQSGHIKRHVSDSSKGNSKKRPRSEAGDAVATWLRGKLDAFLAQIGQWLHSSNASARVLALRTLAHFVAHGPIVKRSTDEASSTFCHASLQLLVASLLRAAAAEQEAGNDAAIAEDVMDALQEELSDEFDDFRMYLLHAITAAAQFVQAGTAGSATSQADVAAASRMPAGVQSLLAQLDAAMVGTVLVALLGRVSVPPSEAVWGPRSFLVPPDVAGGADDAADEQEAAASSDSDDEDAAYLTAHAASGAGTDLSATTAQYARAGRAKQKKRARASLREKTGGVVAAKAGSIVHQHRAFQDAWLGVMRLPLPRGVIKGVLGSLRDEVLPCMREPLRLADFLTVAYAQGGSVALLALEALWFLMTEHDLEYPQFYPKLYALLTPANMRARFKARFMQLLDMFLSSAALPAYLVAAFAKRLARLSVAGPPTVACLALPLMYNMLKRHPACTPLLHRPMIKVGRVPKPAPVAVEGSAAPAPPKSVAGGAFTDPFDADTNDPAQSNALGSQLWEVVLLQSHYVPQVARLASLFSREFTRSEFSVAGAATNTFESLSRGSMRPNPKILRALQAKAQGRGRFAAKPSWLKNKRALKGDSALQALSVTPLAIHTQDSVGDAVREALFATGGGDDGWQGNPYFLKPVTDDEEGEGKGAAATAAAGEILPPPRVEGDEGDDGAGVEEAERQQEAAAHREAVEAEAAGGAYGAPFFTSAGSTGAISKTVALGIRSVNLLPHILDMSA